MPTTEQQAIPVDAAQGKRTAVIDLGCYDPTVAMRVAVKLSSDGIGYAEPTPPPVQPLAVPGAKNVCLPAPVELHDAQGPLHNVFVEVQTLLPTGSKPGKGKTQQGYEPHLYGLFVNEDRFSTMHGRTDRYNTMAVLQNDMATGSGTMDRPTYSIQQPGEAVSPAAQAVYRKARDMMQQPSSVTVEDATQLAQLLLQNFDAADLLPASAHKPRPAKHNGR